ncbi:MAG: branched-chain amino acid ABC transporter permease [Actinomycetota bacterium]|nr:branched-chain amino acid ABC transporter permease [Actinomycetota bacterium]MEA2024522.1 branched-chain amino acid ABC transporter permease [Actinomycetota bacterium]
METLHSQQSGFFARHRMVVVVTVAAIVFPFFIGFLDGQSPAAVIASEGGNAKFLMGLAIEVFILALFALSYDLILGFTGLFSLGHMMFFGVGAYGAGIMLKSLDWSLPATVIGVVVLGVLQAVLFGIVLPRVQGITFALVTLGFGAMFSVVIQSPELSDHAGSDVGLAGASSLMPEWINTTENRFRLYLLVFAILLLVYLAYRQIVASPTGAVMVANRDNPERAAMLGYNTFWFQFFALVVSSITAAVAGMLWALHQPIVTPAVAGLGWMIAVLLMVIMGGLGTLTGAIVGAAAFRLLGFYLEKWFGGGADLMLGITFILIVLLLPYGIVGTWRARSVERKQGWARLIRLVRPGSGG